MISLRIFSFVLLIQVLVVSVGCRTLTDEALCVRNRDCPEDFPFCGESRDDAGVGLCVDEEPPVDIVDAGPFVFDRPDAGVADVTE